MKAHHSRPYPAPEDSVTEDGSLWTLRVSGEDILVRPVRLDAEVTELTALLHRAYRRLADLGFQYVASFQDDSITRERAAKGTCLVAVSGDRIVGTITFYDSPPEQVAGSGRSCRGTCTRSDSAKTLTFRLTTGDRNAGTAYPRHGCRS